MTKLIEAEAGSVDWDVYSDLETIDEEGNEIYSPEYVKIDNLFVKPEFRGNGVARSLMAQAIAKIEADFPGMTIKIVPEPKSTGTDLSRLAAFYESLGLEVVAF
jgi:GNAT superfamily N-acetyltransferase